MAGKQQTNFSHLANKMKGSGAAYDERFWSFVQKQFPLVDGLIYMNNGGLGPSPFPVIDAVYSAMLELEGISETGHHLHEEVNKKAAKFFNCDDEEIAFTRNATEGMNIIARGLSLKKGDEVLMTTHEHPGGGMPWLALANDTRIRVRLFEPGMSHEENLKIIESNISCSNQSAGDQSYHLHQWIEISCGRNCRDLSRKKYNFCA